MNNEELVMLYQHGDNKALEQLTKQNEKLIYKIANRFYVENTNSIDFEDLVQEGYLGLITACNKYDPNLNTKFITYAFYWIYQSISRFFKYKNTNDETSLNTPVGEDNNELLDLMESKDKPIENLEDKLYIQELREDLESVMERYNTMNEREVLKLTYGWDIEPVAPDTIADLLKTSSDKVKKTRVNAINKIRRSMWFKKEYNKRFKYDVTFNRVLRNIDLGI